MLLLELPTEIRHHIFAHALEGIEPWASGGGPYFWTFACYYREESSTKASVRVPLLRVSR